MSNLLTTAYWFESLPTPFITPVLQFLLTMFIGMVVLGFVLHLLARQRRANRMWREGVARLAAVLFQSGIVGLLLAWFAEDQVPFFGIRFWLAVLAVVTIVRLALVLKRMLKDIPAKMAQTAESDRIKKYL
jgi:ABC-type transport system involved in cytochrome c biogenesis permease subunit